MNAYITKNFWGYEELNPPPNSLTSEFVKFYITDNYDSADILKNIGWDEVIIVTNYQDIIDVKTRRRIISEINCFPQKYIKELDNFNKVFVVDSNVIELWDEFLDFTSSSPSHKCLYVTSGWYSGERNTIMSELKHSNQKRWEHDYEHMKLAVNCYKNKIESLGVSFNNVPVISAKYFGWNLKHESYEKISKSFYEEYCNHLQGNIILSYLKIIYNDDIFNYIIKNCESGKLSKHKFLS
jgi:hypothetical protein